MHAQKELLAKKACEVMHNAYGRYSKYQVGAAVLAEDGSIFVGCNVENASYGLTVCAERVAIFSLISAGKKKVEALALVVSGDVLGSPCGACRQVMMEFMVPSAPVYLCNSKTGQIVETTNIEDLLPKSFGSEHLI